MGNRDFDLKPESNKKNVILFGGKNGSGKTTILESIRLALYGPLAFGYKTETPSYFERIYSKLNTFALKKREQLFQIILDFELVENFERIPYRLRRGWNVSKAALKEEFTVQRNFREISNKEKEIFLTKLREEFPPQLLEFFLFDGERISQVISDNTLPEYLRQSAKVMFNLDLFESLENDLQTFVKQETVHNKLTEEEQHLISIKDKLRLYNQRREELLNEKDQVEQDIEEHRALLNALRRDYEVNGGLLREQREELLKKMNEIEQFRGAMMEQNKEIISTILPFCLVRDLLADIVSQMEKESKNEVSSNITALIQRDNIIDILLKLQEHGQVTLNNNPNFVAQHVLQSLIDSLKQFNLEPIHHASVQQRAEVNRIFKETVQFEPSQVINNFKENEKLISQVKELRAKIHNHDSVEELKDILEKINRTQNKLIALQHRKEQLAVHLASIEEDILGEEKNYENLKAKLIQARKSENIFSVVNKVIDVSQKFRRMQLMKKLHQVEMETTSMLQHLFRKELFVVKVFIHPETFILKLYGSNNEEISKESLSAGEKHILLLSTIWAMAKCSRRKLPFVFDTLLGRLDQTHKKRILQHFLPECGEQVLILSTDSEIDQEHYEIIKPIVSHTYTLEFNTLHSTVESVENYFDF